MHQSRIRARIVNTIIISYRIPKAVCSVLLILASDCAAASAQAMPSEPALDA
jgi:hypothetical protein